MMHFPSIIPRRSILRAFTITAAAPYLVPSHVLGVEAPSRRITIGMIGIGGRGMRNLTIYCGMKDARVLAVCDVDAGHLRSAKKAVEDTYRSRGQANPHCDAYVDFRDVLARPDIDAVVICTPDHWHGPLSVMAAEAGKDIYCEKPISLTIAEGRHVTQTMKRLGVVYQSGTQRRSVAHFRSACELVRNRRIGKLKRIVEYLGTGPSCAPQKPRPVPPGFDYDMWLGPAPEEPYTPLRCHKKFRWIYDYSGGKITDQGAHFLDIAQWAMDTEYTGPLTIDGRGTFPNYGLWDTAETYNVTCRYENGVELNVRHELVNNDWAIRFEGEDGWLLVNRYRLFASRPDITAPLTGDEITLERSDHHQQNFLNAVKTRTQPISPPEIAHRSTTVCHLCNLSLRLGRKLVWDPKIERFVDDETANRMLQRSYRQPWRV